MKIRIVALALVVVGASACSSGSSGSKSLDPKSAEPTTSVAATANTGFFGKAQTAACSTDLVEVANAVQMYLVENGTVAVTEDALIDAGLLRDQSTLHDIGADNAVVASPNGGCVS